MLFSNANKAPKVSILVPIYNTSKYLPECLDSRLPHRHQPFLVALSHYPHEAFLQKDLGYTQG